MSNNCNFFIFLPVLIKKMFDILYSFSKCKGVFIHFLLSHHSDYFYSSVIQIFYIIFLKMDFASLLLFIMKIVQVPKFLIFVCLSKIKVRKHCLFDIRWPVYITTRSEGTNQKGFYKNGDMAESFKNMLASLKSSQLR